jgi:hypothetical protein
MANDKQISDLKAAAAKLVDAVMRDEGGFSLETLHAINEMAQAAGLPDYTGVTARTEWSISGSDNDEVRFWGATALTDIEAN